MTDKRHPVIQSMIDTVEEVLDPEAAAIKKAQKGEEPKPQMELDPQMLMLLQLLQSGVDPKILFPDMKDEQD